MIDAVACSFFPVDWTKVGIGTVVGCAIYNSVIFIVFSSINSTYEQEKAKLAVSNAELRNTTLVQQIKAHFIFNVLGTISAFCKEDARKADEAIHLFARYLRAYLYFINQQKTIPVQDELEMVKHYLELEQMRFGNALSCSISLKYTSFNVPPLAIQTLVENAVIHGIRKKAGGGVIEIITQRRGRFAQVIVQDTGMGFDTKAPHAQTSVGLQNVQQRVQMMSDGTLDMQSKVGVGTKAVLQIPIS